MNTFPGGLDLAVDRLVLDGIALPADAVPTFAGLIEAELRQILDAGWPAEESPSGAASSGPAELEPLILSTPPDVPALARALAERIAERAAVEGAWDG